MCQRNSDILVKCCFRNELPQTIPTLVDYFGSAAFDESKDVIVLGVYRGLVMKGIKSNLLHNCLVTRRLNELIHKKYTFRKSGYYRKFCDLGIDLDQHHLKNNFVKRLPIYDDNHCPTCNTEGYISLEYYKIKSDGPDCERCFDWMCTKCYGGRGLCKKCLSD